MAGLDSCCFSFPSLSYRVVLYPVFSYMPHVCMYANSTSLINYSNDACDSLQDKFKHAHACDHTKLYISCTHACNFIRKFIIIIIRTEIRQHLHSIFHVINRNRECCMVECYNY